MPYPNRLNVVVVGGSLAGLFTAVVIKGLANVQSITVLERYQAEQLQDLGAGIRVNDEVCDTLLEYTGQPPEKYAAWMYSARFVNTAGETVMEQPVKAWMSTWAQLYRVLRQSFDADPKCTYRHGCVLQDLTEQDPSTVKVFFRDEQGEDASIDANLVIGADGASSKARLLMLPEAKRTAVGYVLYRGVLADSELTPASAELFRDAGTFHWAPSSQAVSYIVPRGNGPADEAQKLVNWVWYQHKSDEDTRKMLIDKNGVQHRFALPAGGMNAEEVRWIKEKAAKELPPAYAEAIGKTAEPFVQVVTDSLAGSNIFLGGKLLLVGDAVGGQRPHVASALMQCAFHGRLVKTLLEESTTPEHWAKSTQAFSSILVQDGKKLGEICMSDAPDQTKSPVYFKAFMETQAKLSGMWKEVISASCS